LSTAHGCPILPIERIDRRVTGSKSAPGHRDKQAAFLIERNFAERLELDGAMAREITRVNDDVGVRWLTR
jgi:hypothetical protein